MSNVVISDSLVWPSADAGFRGLCHDLVQPVAAILLTADKDQDLDPRLQMIFRQATWMSEMIEGALAGPRVADVEPVQVSSVVSAAVDRARTYSLSGIQCLLDPDASVPICASTLGRAVSCLLDNAIRASAGGSVVVRVCVETDSVVIDVADDGPGPGNLPRGHGIGLDAARDNLAPYGARISLHPLQPRGTRAQIWLPIPTRSDGD